MVVVISIIQQPHDGISLLINGSIARNEDFPCHTISHVLGPEVIFFCTARKSGIVFIESNVVFCSIDFTAHQKLRKKQIVCKAV